MAHHSCPSSPCPICAAPLMQAATDALMVEREQLRWQLAETRLQVARLQEERNRIAEALYEKSAPEEARSASIGDLLAEIEGLQHLADEKGPT